MTPTVQRHYLFAFAGVLWTIAGGILCTRGAFWIAPLSMDTMMIVYAVSLAIAVGGYLKGFSKIAERNIERIKLLPERANIFAFTPLRGYIMIALMVTIGITLRNSSLPKQCLTVPYESMGGVLLMGSYRFYREFFGSLVKRRG